MNAIDIAVGIVIAFVIISTFYIWIWFVLIYLIGWAAWTVLSTILGAIFK